MNTELWDLLQTAAARPRHPPDLDDVRRRAALIRRRRAAAAIAAAIGLVLAPAGVLVFLQSAPSVVLTDDPDAPPEEPATTQGCEPEAEAIEAARERYPESTDSEETLRAMVCADQDDRGEADLEPLRDAARTEHSGPFSPTREARDHMRTAMHDAWLLAYTDFSDASRVQSLRAHLPQPDPATDALLRDVVTEWSGGNFVAAYALLERAVAFPTFGCMMDAVACDEAGKPIPPSEAG